MADNKELLLKLREETGLGIMDIKKALTEAAGDEAQARAILKDRGEAIMAKKSEREAGQGIVEAYAHGGRIGVIVEVNCETDFVARNPDFQSFARDLALQIASMEPADVAALLAQDYIKDGSQTVGDQLAAITAKMGEKIVVARFCRFALGEE